MKATRNKSSSSDDCASEIISPKRSLQHATSSQNKRLFANSSLCDLSVSQLKALVSTLNHTLGRDKTESYQHILHEECIDGFCLSQLGCDELAGIGFDPNVKTLFKEILNFSNMKSLLMQATSPPNALALNPSQPSNSQHMALNISAVPCPPPLHTYGQLVVLGSREHRITNEQVIYATGSSNDVFPLVRQSVASGVKIVTENVYLCQEKVDRDSGESVHVSFVDSKQLSFVRQSDECGSVASFRMVLDTSPELLHKISPRGRQGSRPVAEETSALLPYMFEAIFGPDSAFDMFQVGRHDGTFTVDNYDNVSSSLGATPAIRRVNDVVIKGLVVNGQTSRGVASRVAAHKGAVSRVACRVLCERSTGRAFLFAGGFSASKTLSVADKAPQWIRLKSATSSSEPATATSSAAKALPSRPAPSRPSFPRQNSRHRTINTVHPCDACSSSAAAPAPDNFCSNSVSSNYEYDALTLQGVKVYFPSCEAWREVSVMGRVYMLREECSGFGHLTSQSNELQPGCIIDIGGGVCLTYTSGNTLSPLSGDMCADTSNCKEKCNDTITSSAGDPNVFISRLNSQNPVCPVLMNNLHFPARLPAQRHALVRLRTLRTAGQESGFVACQQPNGASLPALIAHTCVADGIDEDQQPYVFPACGHCFGFNAAFSGKACPLCRQIGPYVPLIFPFVSAICAEQPTHVFHPCGHAASLETCKRWSKIPLPDTLLMHEYLFPHLTRRGRGEGRPATRRQSGAGDAFDADPSGCSARHASICLPRHPACPFCSKKLELTAAGGDQRFSKLVVQFEDGNMSLSDI